MQLLYIKFRQKIYRFPAICKPVLLLALTIAVSITAFASGGPNALNWKRDTSVSNVDFYHAISVCDGKTVVFLKFVNKNKQAVKISWKEAFKTQIRTELNSLRGKQELTLAQGETMAQNCSVSTCKECMIAPDQVNPTYQVQIQDFSFKDITVTR